MGRARSRQEPKTPVWVFNAAIGAFQMPLGEVAERVGRDYGYLNRVLRGHIPLSVELEKRLIAALGLEDIVPSLTASMTLTRADVMNEDG